MIFFLMAFSAANHERIQPLQGCRCVATIRARVGNPSLNRQPIQGWNAGGRNPKGYVKNPAIPSATEHWVLTETSAFDAADHFFNPEGVILPAKGCVRRSSAKEGATLVATAHQISNPERVESFRSSYVTNRFGDASPITRLLKFATLTQNGPEGRATAEVVLFADSPQIGKSLATALGSEYLVSQFTSDKKETTLSGKGSTRMLNPKVWNGKAVVLPEQKNFADRDRYEFELRTKLQNLHTQFPRASLYVCVPKMDPLASQMQDVVPIYFAPLTRQAARETGAKPIELADTPTVAQAIAEVVADPRIEKKGWKLVSADSEETDEGPAINAIDGNADTFWHTRYDPTVAKYPHEIVVDMGTPALINGFRYLPRQDGGVNGMVKAYEFYVSADGKNWGLQAAQGSFPNTRKATRVTFAAPVTARYFRFVAKSEQSGGPWATAAEIDVLRAHP